LIAGQQGDVMGKTPMWVTGECETRVLEQTLEKRVAVAADLGR
jgi:hypothetical protein